MTFCTQQLSNDTKNEVTDGPYQLIPDNEGNILPSRFKLALSLISVVTLLLGISCLTVIVTSIISLNDCPTISSNIVHDAFNSQNTINSSNCLINIGILFSNTFTLCVATMITITTASILYSNYLGHLSFAITCIKILMYSIICLFLTEGSLICYNSIIGNLTEYASVYILLIFINMSIFIIDLTIIALYYNILHATLIINNVTYEVSDYQA